MLDLDRTMFFKSKFEIEAPAGRDALWSLIMSVRGWSLSKARRDGYSLPEDIREWSRFKRGEAIESSDGGVRLYSALHRGERASTWACRHMEDQRVPGWAPRRWFTEVGFEGFSAEAGVVSIITMYSDMPGFIGPLQPEPAPNVPGLIARILENDLLTCRVDGREFALGPREFAVDDAAAAFDIIADPNRAVPVVMVSPTRAGERLVDPATLAAHVGPNAFVLSARDCESMDALNSRFRIDGLGCYGGAVRVYAPHPHLDIVGDGMNHRFFSAADIRRNGEDCYTRMLRRALAQDVHAWETSIRIEDVKRLNRNASRERAFKRRSEEIQDMALEQVAEMLDDADLRLHEAETQRDGALDQLRACKQVVYDLEAKSSMLESALSAHGARSRGGQDGLSTVLDGAAELSVPVIGRLFAAAYPDRIDFSERGWASLEDCSYDPRAFWSAMHSMCCVLYPLYRDDVADIAGEFNRCSRFRFARGEGPQTRANNRLMRERDDVYQGRAISIEPHISSSTGDPCSPQFIRIYFAWDEETCRLVIGDTKHLANSTTRKL